ncbi:hypothetical protein B296_00026510 [Ensete ventricosum]|uniref:BI1-like protein n=1 Tax=Ensete ventricosum TaxID=4639 RepID=A0A426Z4D2_ENSVE|nr:hypothetical protein B296_00026510 [Ensete ventricosum]
METRTNIRKSKKGKESNDHKVLESHARYFCSNLQLKKLGSSSFHPPRKQRVLLLRRVSQGPGGAQVDDDRPLPRRREVINQASASRVAAFRLRVPQPLRALRDRPIEHRQHPCHRAKCLSVALYWTPLEKPTGLFLATRVLRHQTRGVEAFETQFVSLDTVPEKMWARPPYGKGGDAESGAQPLYPAMLEPPALRWAFIRKIYSILVIQMVLTVAVASVVVAVRPVSQFFVSSAAGLGLYIFLIILPFIASQDFNPFFGCAFATVLCPLYYYYQHHPWNFLLLGVFTVSISFAVGLTCAFTSGNLLELFENI